MVDDVLAGRYRLEEPIATGGMGTVWRARDEVLERAVAVKILHETLASDPAASERFRREALTAASIHHPHMANVFDYVEEEGRPGIVMELVQGETLATLLARGGAMPVGEAVQVASDVLTALEAAHDKGIVHRDIKPGNILIMPNGRVKVSDFGIARSLGDASLTVTGTVMGTAHYSAPEQVRGESTSPATDLYAVGIVLYEMLTGERPFQADTAVAVAMARLENDPVPPRELRTSLPRALDAAVMRALARDPSKRFASAVEMRAAVESSAKSVAIAPVTQAFAVGPADTTIAMSSMRPSEQTKDVPVVGEYVPPPWAGKRILVVLLPLLLLGALSYFIVAAMRDGGVTPAAGPSVTPSPSATPTVSLSGRVPRLIGMTIEQARAKLALRDLVLDLKLSRYVEDDSERGTIVDQNPTAGSLLKPGDAVTVSVSSGPPRKNGKKGRGHDDD